MFFFYLFKQWVDLDMFRKRKGQRRWGGGECFNKKIKEKRKIDI